MKDLLKILESLSGIITVFKPRESIVKQKAKKRQLKNEMRSMRNEKRKLRIQKKINKRKLKL